MLDDPKIPDVVKSLLSHLHTPYLKLALLDQSFLGNQQHPARVLLDRMAETGARWVADDKDRVALPKLKTVVETILSGFIDDSTVFERLLDDFERFRESLDKRAEMVEKRNRAAQEGIERLNAARQRSAGEVADRTKSLVLPESVQQLLQKPWTDYLAFNLLRNGDQSPAWTTALKVVDGVLWSLQSGHSQSAAELQRYRQQLRQALADGMQVIGYDGQAGGALLDALDDAQERAAAPPHRVRHAVRVRLHQCRPAATQAGLVQRDQRALYVRESGRHPAAPRDAGLSGAGHQRRHYPHQRCRPARLHGARATSRTRPAGARHPLIAAIDLPTVIPGIGAACMPACARLAMRARVAHRGRRPACARRGAPVP
jgi:hypothetical protein